MKVVTVGTSKICSTLIKAMKDVDIEVFACVGRDNERTKQFAKENSVPYHASDYDTVVASDAFDTVYLALPNSLHYEYAKKALENGKNVICEKPLTSNLKEASELVMLANNKKVFLFDATTTIHLLSFKQLKDDIKLLGQIRLVDTDFSRYSSKYDDFLNNKPASTFDPNLSGGALMDMGLYNISFIVGLFGLPEALRYYPNMQRGIDTSGVAILKYDGFVATSICGKDANEGTYFHIKGEKGYIVSNQSTSLFNEYEIHLNDGTIKKRVYDSTSHYKDELLDFKSMYDYKNYQKNNSYLTNTLMNMKVLDELRKSCGLKFSADNKASD